MTNEVKTVFSSIKQALSKTSAKIGKNIREIMGRGITKDTIAELEELLLAADLGVKATEQIIKTIQSEKHLHSDSAIQAIKSTIVELIESSECDKSSIECPSEHRPYVIMLCGMNGSGKTTTTGKLAQMLSDKGKKVGIVACDTFRAAAQEQLEAWTRTTGTHFFVGKPGSDPASVAYTGCAQAKEQDLDYLIIDTAGRMHNKPNLMDELAKINRTITKIIPGGPHKTILVVDGNSGQNALKQITAYSGAVKIDGLIVTKLDSSAKGGVILSIIADHKLPVYYIGTGEQALDLRDFNAEEFAESIFSSD